MAVGRTGRQDVGGTRVKGPIKRVKFGVNGPQA